MDNYQIITSAEERFAREVTLGVIIQRPLPALLYVIPGMFFIEYLRRGSAVRKYTKHFMFPRKLALSAAERVSKGEDEQEIRMRVATEIKKWLNSLGLYSPAIAHAQQQSIELIFEHYLKLLGAEGDSLHDLIKDAYPAKEDYVAYLTVLSRADKEIDRAIVAKVGKNEKLVETQRLEAGQIEKRHQKIMAQIY